MNDALSAALSSMQVSGSLLLHEGYVPPWAISVPSASSVGTLLGLAADQRAVAFHYVHRGQFQLQVDSGPTTSVQAGDIAICFGGAPHRMAEGRHAEARSLADLLRGGAARSVFDAEGVGASATVLVCGVFLLRDTLLNPLFGALPAVLVASCSRVQPIVDRLMEELDLRRLGGQFAIGRLVELLCVEAIRSHIDALPQGDIGWFKGLVDLRLGRVLGEIHRSPGDPWTVASLAKLAGLSPSRFAARFHAALGEGPMAYVTKWRMNVACRMLSQTDSGIGDIAAQVGYENFAAFCRAFKRHMGAPPAAWRHGERGSELEMVAAAVGS